MKTEPLVTPEPEIVSYGYNHIEIRKVNNYINYSLDYNYRVVDLGETIKLTNLEPNVKYEITAKYIFNAEKIKSKKLKFLKHYYKLIIHIFMKKIKFMFIIILILILNLNYKMNLKAVVILPLKLPIIIQLINQLMLVFMK